MGMIKKFTDTSFYYFRQGGGGGWEYGWGFTSYDGFGGDTPAFFKLIFTWCILKIWVFAEGKIWYNMYPQKKTISEI